MVRTQACVCVGFYYGRAQPCRAPSSSVWSLYSLNQQHQRGRVRAGQLGEGEGERGGLRFPSFLLRGGVGQSLPPAALACCDLGGACVQTYPCWQMNPGGRPTRSEALAQANGHANAEATVVPDCPHGRGAPVTAGLASQAPTPSPLPTALSGWMRSTEAAERLELRGTRVHQGLGEAQERSRPSRGSTSLGAGTGGGSVDT